jgi:hypothetical protein
LRIEREDDSHTHTEQEDVMKKGNGKALEAKKTNSKKADEISIPPGKEMKAKKESTRLVGKTTGMTRMAWFLDVLRKNREAKLSDEKIDAMAVKEFGTKNIPGENGTFSADHLRGWFTYCAKAGRGGVKKSETFTAHNAK